MKVLLVQWYTQPCNWSEDCESDLRDIDNITHMIPKTEYRERDFFFFKTIFHPCRHWAFGEPHI